MRRATLSTGSQRRRFIAAALALVGFALVAVAGAEMLRRPPQDAQLDERSQLERVLPPPHERAALPKAVVVTPRAKPRKRRREWKQLPAPVRLGIPAIGVSAPVIPLRLNTDGTTQTPDNTTDTGWFSPGPEPGEKGAAVIIGHVDSRSGPGVFYHLRALRRGDRITVVLRNHRRLRFLVTGSKQAPKDRFPTELVFARTANPTLRLVTCGGSFDQSTRHYIDNYIVFARLVGHP